MSEVPLDVDLVSGDFWGGNPHEALARLRATDPVYFDRRNGVWGITKYEHVKEIETNPAVFSSAGGIRPDSGPLPMMIDMDDPEHALRRKLVDKGFTPRRVRAMEPKVTAVVDRLLEAVEGRKTFDLVRDVAAWLPLVVIAEALGIEEERHSDVLRWSDDLMRGLGASDPGLVERMMQAFASWQAYVSTAVLDRRQAPRDDITSVLVHAVVDGHRLDDDALTYETLLILIGGDETTRHVITGGAYQLLIDRSRWERLRRDRSLLTPAVEEMLRWVSPIKNMCRTATRDVHFHGKLIRRGEKVMLLYPSANRDEEKFPHAFRFDIERSPNDHIAFGAGPHFCLGASLARLELRCFFQRLLDRMPDLDLVEAAEPSYRPANFVSGYETLPVRRTG